jgi:uncharacterized protein YbbC (DUF1343 family)
MIAKVKKIIIQVFISLVFTNVSNAQDPNSGSIKVGAEQTEKYLPILNGKNVAIVANQTSVIGNKHLVDSLLTLGVKIKKILCPEHGFRGDAEAGELLKNHKDAVTGLPVVSLYGNNKKPKPADLKNVDVVIFDIQDVGARFYTYISTMHYVMEACAENKVLFLVLDRPNPNGNYVDGPVLKKEFKTFVGMHPVPIVHGMTIAEYALMINGEGWLTNGIKCDLKYIPVLNYSHKDLYQLKIKPSPNLPNMTSIYLYPSLCWFEGTVISVGRGTDKPFQVIGHPDLKGGDFTFTPRSIKGASLSPPLLGVECNGFDLTTFADYYIRNSKHIYLFWLMEAYKNMNNKENFFNPFFNNLAGNATLQQQIIDGVSEENIRNSWEPELSQYKLMRKKYLLYEDF